MTNLGKCMLFYLKYAAEMERLYEAEERKVKGLPNPDQILKQIALVGDTANREVAAFLETCARGIEEHFHAIGDVQQMRNNLENTWELKFKVAPKKATGRQFQIGVQIDSNRAAVIPWVWCPGGRRAEDEVVRILGRGIKSDKLPEWASGSVWTGGDQDSHSRTTGRVCRVRLVGRQGPAGICIVHGAESRGDRRDRE